MRALAKHRSTRHENPRIFQTPLGEQPAYGAELPTLQIAPRRPDARFGNKLLKDLDAVFDSFGIESGQTLSFHHHYRNGDHVLIAVIKLAERRGLRDLTVLASSIFPVHAPLVRAMENGVISHIVCDYMRGPVADFIAQGGLGGLAVLQSHGGRARAITARQVEIDVAFVAAPMAHISGAATGRAGRLACGPMGYPAVDAAYANNTVVLADEITRTVLPHVDVPALFVDALVHFPDPGDASEIQSGSTVPNRSATAMKIANSVVQVLSSTGHLRNGMSLQSGAGGYSLGAVPVIGQEMASRDLKGGFLSGGITGAHTDLLEASVFRKIRDVQCFDRAAINSSITNPDHQMMTASDYANPINADACVNDLDVMLLGAVQVDRDFNVNVVCGGDRRILGGPGGHPDTAHGSKLAIVTTTLTGGGYAKCVPQVDCCSTLGADVDVVVTDQGVAVNPSREDLISDLKVAGVRLEKMEALIAKADGAAIRTAPAASCQAQGRILVEHRDGAILDIVS